MNAIDPQAEQPTVSFDAEPGRYLRDRAGLVGLGNLKVRLH